MKIDNTQLPGVLLIKPDIQHDFRGEYVMVYHEDKYINVRGYYIKWREECISVSAMGTLRGIHADFSCHKLISVFHGAIYYVVVDCVETSVNFGKWQAFILSDKNYYQIFKPAQYGAGFLALTEDAVFHYKQDTFYDPKRQVTFKYDDKRFNIFWPTIGRLMSQRDTHGDSSLI